MQKEITVTVFPEDEKNQDTIENLLKKELSKNGIQTDGKKIQFVFVKKSVDARHGKVKFHLRYRAFIGEEAKDFSMTELPDWKNLSKTIEKNTESGANGSGGKIRKVAVVGSGPAGLFASLKLLEKGICPVIIEQGKETKERRKDIARISRDGVLDSFSNYCFGEGGAGTFSDGKLYTRSAKRGNIPGILQILVHFGADPKILTDSHPHIGTEKLPKIINNIRDFIKETGGEFHFGSKATDFIVKDGKAEGVVFENILTGEKTEFLCDSIILAQGHSSYDIYRILAGKNPSSLEEKTFAMGVRVEHPRKLIDKIQYHGKTDGMEAAEYRLTSQIEGRGVYSFCMCPGGFVVPSASSPDEIVVNGMSASGRNSKWSNSAIVVEIRPEDIPEKFAEEAEKLGSPALKGLLFRKWLEKETKKHGDGQKAPSQVLTDFLEGKESVSIPETSFSPGTVSSRLDKWLPGHISLRLKKAFPEFEKKMRGFVTSKAVLIASETRTSTPARIKREKESLECEGIRNLYPCGEGSGYAGGIVSSAMDGEKAAEKIAEKFGADAGTDG